MDPEFMSLLSRFVDGELSDAEIAKLDAWLQSDGKARQVYLRYMAMELDLAEQVGLIQPVAKSAKVAAAQACSRAVAGRPAHRDPGLRRRTLFCIGDCFEESSACLARFLRCRNDLGS